MSGGSGKGGGAPAPRIVIVGGGLSGLTTAYRLLKEAKAAGRALDVTVLEMRYRVGGMCVAFRPNGRTVEHGSHGFFGSGVGYYVNSVGLTKELGTRDTLQLIPGWTLVHGSGKRALMTHAWWLPRVLDTVPSLMRVPWLRFRSRLRLLWAAFKLYWIKAKDYPKYDAKNGYDTGLDAGYDHDGAITWNMASLGLTNQFVDADPARNDPGQSGAIFIGKHRVLLGSKQGLSYLLPTGDLTEVLAIPLHREIEAMGGRIVLDTKATSIDREGKRVHAEGPDGPVEHAYDDLVIALQPWAAAKLVTWQKAPWQELKPTSPVLMLTVQLSGRIKASVDGRELGMSRKDWPFSVITDLSRLFPEFAPEKTGDKTVLRIEIGHADLPPGEAPIEEVLVEVKKGLDRLWPECKPMTIEWHELNHERELLYVSWVRGEFSKKPDAAARQVDAHAYLAGDWTSLGTIGMESAVISAYETVNWIHGRHRWPTITFPNVPLRR